MGSKIRQLDPVDRYFVGHHRADNFYAIHNSPQLDQVYPWYANNYPNMTLAATTREGTIWVFNNNIRDWELFNAGSK